MLNEDEFQMIADLYRNGIKATKEFSEKYRLPLENSSIDERFRPLREKYSEITGHEEIHQNAIMHHRISIYGDPCENCGKPLRTPQAAFCAACGQTVGEKV